jgi:hypothetical protein
MSFLTELSSFVKQAEDAENASFDLWTWLPSYKRAQECRGDYAVELRPTPEWVMREACELLADRCNPSEEKLADPFGMYGCPCQGNCEKVTG